MTRAATSTPGATCTASVLRLFFNASEEKSAASSFGLSSAPSSWRADLAIQPVVCTGKLNFSAAGFRLSGCS